MPLLIEMLNNFVSDGTILSSVPFNILDEIPSGPLALDTSRERIRAATSSSQQRKSSGQWLDGHSFRDSSNGGTAGLKQLEKKSFSILALAELVDADISFNIRVGMVDFCLLRHLIAFQNCFLLVELKVLK